MDGIRRFRSFRIIIPEVNIVADTDLDEDHAGESDLQRKHCNVTMAKFYGYRLQHRDTDGIMLVRGDRLWHQYIVDAYAAIEQNRFKYLRMNKKKLRTDLYQGLQNAIVANDNSAVAIGQRIILPSSFTVGPRHMVQNYEDAMAICRWADCPDVTSGSTGFGNPSVQNQVEGVDQ
jgi:hypothetical protein